MVRCGNCGAVLEHLLAECPRKCRALARGSKPYATDYQAWWGAVYAKYTNAVLMREGLQILTGSREPQEAKIGPHTLIV